MRFFQKLFERRKYKKDEILYDGFGDFHRENYSPSESCGNYKRDKITVTGHRSVALTVNTKCGGKQP